MPNTSLRACLFSLFLLVFSYPAFADSQHVLVPEDLSLYSALAESGNETPVTEEETNQPIAPDYKGPIIYEDEGDPYKLPPVSFKSFSKDLGHNFAGLFNEKNMMPLLAGVTLAGVTHSFDGSVSRHFASGNTETLFANTGATAGKPYVLAPAIGGLFFAGLASDNNKFKSFSYALTQGYIMTTSIGFGLKKAVGRERPDGSNNLSFPSGHSADSFMIATVVDQYYGHKAGIVAYGLAGLVAASRVEKDVHWLSDVVAGATLGYIVGRTVTRNMGGFSLSKKVAVAPVVNPFNKEYGLGVTIKLP